MDTKTVTFTFPADAWDGIVNAFCHDRYQDEVDGQPNTQTREQFATACVLDFVSETYKTHSVSVLTEQARQQAIVAADERVATVKAESIVSVE